MPYRAPGAPEPPKSKTLSDKPIRYYRPRGSADVRHLIDEGFQAFNAARLWARCASGATTAVVAGAVAGC